MRDILPLLLVFTAGCDPVERPLGLTECGSFRGQLASLPDLDLSTCMERCGANYDTRISLIDAELAWLAFTPHCTAPADQEALKQVAFEISMPREELVAGNSPPLSGWLTDSTNSEPTTLGFEGEITVYEEMSTRGDHYVRLGWDLPFGQENDSGATWAHLTGEDWMLVEDLPMARAVSHLASPRGE